MALHDSDDERFAERFRAAGNLPPAPPAPPANEIWDSGTARIRRRRTTRMSLVSAAAAVVVVALAVPVVDNLNSGPDRSPSEISTAGASDDELIASTTTNAPSNETVEQPTTTVEAPVATTPSVVPPTESSDVPTRAPQDVPAPQNTPTPTTTVSPDTQPSPQTDGPPRGDLIGDPASELRDAARAFFGAAYGGITAPGGVLTVHVKPGQEQVPASFQGHPVVATTYSWDDLQATMGRIQSQAQELNARGVAFMGCNLDNNLQIMVSVASWSPAIDAAATDVIGAGPWYLFEATGSTSIG